MPPFYATIATTDTASNTGSATVTAQGGAGSYTYKWYQNGALMAGAVTNAITALTPGLYHCEVTSGSAMFSIGATIKSTTLLLTPAATYLNVQWPPVTNAKTYTISYSTISATAGMQVFMSNFGGTFVIIPNLSPATKYYVRIQAMVNKMLTDAYSGSSTLLANSTSNYTKQALPTTGGSADRPASQVMYDVRSLPTTGAVTRDSILASTLQTGNLMSVQSQKPGTSITLRNVKMLKPTESIPVTKQSAIYIPVTTAGQVSNLVLSNSTTQPITVNASSVVVNGTTYTVGTTFVMDGQRVEVRSG